ncbi:MAG: homogentisate 1,2-dioxygenase [Planctomycetota bacterium]|nr:homogentisate 1,2-dioxygenase [Planctomycetota bacterium]
MPSHRSLGELPAKRHIKFELEKETSFLQEGMAYEHVITTEGFSRAYSVLYHLRPPTRCSAAEWVKNVELESVESLPLQPHHIRSQNIPRGGDPISGRIPMLFNEDLVCWRAKPASQQTTLYRNSGADEVIFIQNGTGIIETSFGVLPYRRGDYVVIPRTTTYLMKPDEIEQEDYLILECLSPVRVPERYLNRDGQILLGSPFYERDFHSPEKMLTLDVEQTTHTLIKDGSRFTRLTTPHHPFDVIGWDGFVYPYTFNAWDFEPLTGTVHLPPPVQQTFECQGFVICTFAPRHLDHHPQAIKVPYAHSNVEADEVLFYVDGQFGSRRGVDLGSLTLHPGGIPHGPHPGTIMASLEVDRTEEMAVMFDTERKLNLTPQAMELDDPDYLLSWLE